MNANDPVVRDGIEYEVFQAERTVVISFINRTSSTLRLTEGSLLTDGTGRSFNVDPQELVPGQSGRVLLPPANAIERTAYRQPAPTDIQARVGGFDEGGIVTRQRLETGGETGELERGFRWANGGRVRAHLVFETTAAPPTATAPSPNVAATTAPASTITHDFILTRTQ